MNRGFGTNRPIRAWRINKKREFFLSIRARMGHLVTKLYQCKTALLSVIYEESHAQR